jgi:ComF family protein
MDTKEYIQSFVNIVYPHCCAACGNVLYRNEDILCLDCYDDLPRTQFHLNQDNEVARIFWGRIPVINATSYMYFTRESRYRQILHELKYRGNQRIGMEMGKMFGLELRETPFAEIDLIHPVPLHRVKLRQRGYNQSELIARGIAEVMNKPVETNLITRAKSTGTQTKKSRYERWENVKDNFHIPEPDLFCNKHVLLIDDVITTGATIEACAESLLSVPGTRISIASLACVQLQ